MTNGRTEVLLTADSVLDLVDLLEERRSIAEAGAEPLTSLDEDTAFQFWQGLWRHLADDINLPPDMKLSLGSSSHAAAVLAVQAVLEAAHKYYGLDRRRLIDLARNEGPSEGHLASTVAAP